MASETEYRFAIAGATNNVEVHDREGLRYCLRVTQTARRGFLGRQLALDLDLVDLHGQSTLQIRRTRRQPFSRYSLIRAGGEIGIVACTHLLQHKYLVALATSPEWTVRMPLFSVRFSATAENEQIVRIQMLKENLWAVLFGPGQDSPEFLGSLGLIFRARWTSS
jgi:hypothetical protein